MKILAEYSLDCGRHGFVSSLFVTTPEELETLYGRKVYFGEILGKHSEVTDDAVCKSQIEIRSDDQEFIEKAQEILIGRNRSGELGRTISGHNPFDYLEEENS